MLSRRITFVAGLALVAGLMWSAHAQFAGRNRMRWGEQLTTPEQAREQAEMDASLTPGFKDDVFTFARLKFDTDTGRGFRGWDDDSPESDLNLSYRMYQVTSVKVRPGLHAIDISPEELAKYPFAYAAAGGRMHLNGDEITALRQYLLNGGFLMVDDFWGDYQWRHLYNDIKRIFPDREPVELGLDHRIFHTVFNFQKEPQIPSVGDFMRTGRSYDQIGDYEERGHEPHYFAIYDNKDRMMVLICHNNHYGDGWEHESQDETYFDKFSEPMGYPMFINILYYAATH